MKTKSTALHNLAADDILTSMQELRQRSIPISCPKCEKFLSLTEYKELTNRIAQGPHAHLSDEELKDEDFYCPDCLGT